MNDKEVEIWLWKMLKFTQPKTKFFLKKALIKNVKISKDQIKTEKI